jgi:trehalose 6-phosphate synthase
MPEATRTFPSAIESAIVVASNRGPISFEHDETGALTSQRGAGGLVTALSGVFFRDDTTWVAAAMTGGDREVAIEGFEIDPNAHQRVRFVVIPPDRYEAYYNQMANRILWFVHHYLWDTARTPTFDEETEVVWQEYVEANRAFAVALAEEGERHPVYLIQDYHLSLVPAMLRELRPDARIAHFTHTPFAGATYLRILPAHMRDAILRGMAGADVVGFQARPWVESFLLSIRDLSGFRVLRGGRFVVGDRVAAARAFPVAVSAHPIRETAATPEVKRVRRELKEWKGAAKLLLRVDRLEPSKNILRGFLAHELFLRGNPSWQGRVRFLALFSPSREALPEYQAYADDCMAEVERINKELSTEEWKPIEVRIQEDYGFAVAAYGLYDALLVNPVYDGMNLVAMEGPLVNRRHGVLILSRNAGAYGRLGKQALTVNPFDIRETADAIRDALEMPEEERKRRARGLSRTVQAHTPPQWLASQLEALDGVRPPAG